MAERNRKRREQRVVKWLPAEGDGQQGSPAVRLRGETVGMPAVLVASRVISRSNPQEMLFSVRMKHWKNGPLGSVTPMEPVTIADHRFARTVFQIYNPRRSTVLSAAAELGDGQGLVVRMVVAGFGRVNERVDQIYEESIRQALEVTGGAAPT